LAEGRRSIRIEAAGGRAAFVRADVRVGDDIRGMAAMAQQVFGGLDILVNNAGQHAGTALPGLPTRALGGGP
jgi:NAD(P)-dependent dehydrogenase (short-subunit alcohol dehydrogenase family)